MTYFDWIGQATAKQNPNNSQTLKSPHEAGFCKKVSELTQQFILLVSFSLAFCFSLAWQLRCS